MEIGAVQSKRLEIKHRRLKTLRLLCAFLSFVADPSHCLWSSATYERHMPLAF